MNEGIEGKRDRATDQARVRDESRTTPVDC